MEQRNKNQNHDKPVHYIQLIIETVYHACASLTEIMNLFRRYTANM